MYSLFGSRSSPDLREAEGRGEFAARLRARVDEVDAELRITRHAFDGQAVEILSGRLESLLRIADRHGIDVRYAGGGPADGAV
ncbi:MULTISPECIES: hypothetical protein [Streptosporangium]|uniref:Uncharacterized protein n=1 Tax=Streptosporangium brasiliense TaxID=47480 RepID=A0ABT9QZQ2_9ACTN|nr:hypothetical protein [Streptosporangium brasiliense]MDP9862433.1 hypothetical protein [Streptosporangium brasiliense]